jgi:hypothetical protein
MENSEGLGPGKFKFRGLQPNILIAMASDRYAGWIGQVYSEGRYTKEIKDLLPYLFWKHPFYRKFSPEREFSTPMTRERRPPASLNFILSIRIPFLI